MLLTAKYDIPNKMQCKMQLNSKTIAESKTLGTITLDRLGIEINYK